ncbi:sulfite exporter TauE/SafE family protein [Pseudohoeflea coraliihabitans]|uniref:Probable membrane transporter protein n=1 Tax=Pseudohoeflea coraliihabitans TaxID=2860393 RepID=A0ABS6WPU2_9HYPH|nr:sulfite exporter TauE/SafE family protein [Pseudohoeflea sp. DP4N28-3]MBW3097989.1 sulfite exporter TauE/SafE family protein [Pseudohoeflea sp. DP4N28-3]
MPSYDELIWLLLALALAGSVAGFLAGLFGIGGGAILVPAFYQAFALADVPEAVRMHVAVGTSLAVIVPTSLRSFLSHRKRDAADLALLKQWMLAVPFGVLLASVIAASVSSAGMRAIFAIITLLLGIRMVLNRQNWRLGDDLPGNPWRAIVGAVIGMVSALMGVGGGVMNNTFMTLYGRPVHQAVATSAGIGVLISAPGLVGYIWAGWGEAGLPLLSTGFINWIAVAMMAPLSMLFAPLGVMVAHALDKRHLEIAFGIFLLTVAARFIYSLL